MGLLLALLAAAAWGQPVFTSPPQSTLAPAQPVFLSQPVFVQQPGLAPAPGTVFVFDSASGAFVPATVPQPVFQRSPAPPPLFLRQSSFLPSPGALPGQAPPPMAGFGPPDQAFTPAAGASFSAQPLFVPPLQTAPIAPQPLTP